MPEWIPTAAFVAARLVGMVFIIPGISLAVVSWRLRALLVFLLSTSVLSILPVARTAPVPAASELVLGIVHELIVGVSLGLAPAVMVWGLQLSARSISGMTGLPSGADPQTGLSSGDALAQLFTITTLTIFFASGGHRQVLEAVLISFDWLAPGHTAPWDSVLALVMEVLMQSFAFAVRVMAPVGLALFISLMALSVVNRIVPQIGYFAVGMSVQNLVLLGGLTLFLGGVGWLLDAEFQETPRRVAELWQFVVQR